ncbi:sigma-70 family RNA polymerase sigma factor [bacterium]|nr:sigma-70 family RNA polymerase sigma factor [bacterium]
MVERERDLVQRIQSGDTSAETELFAKYKDAILWKVCRHIKSDSEDIKDVVSEVYLAVLQGLRDPNFRPAKWASLDAYVWGVTNNKVRDWYGKRKKEMAIFSPNTLSVELVSYTDEYFLEKRELEKALRNLLNKLDSPYREALELRYLREFSIQEMSKKLGIPPRRVSERIHYALKLLRKAWRNAKILSISGLTLLLPLMKEMGVGL